MSNCVINDEIFVHICDPTKTKGQVRCTKAFILHKVFQTTDQKQYLYYLTNCSKFLQDSTNSLEKLSLSLCPHLVQ